MIEIQLVCFLFNNTDSHTSRITANFVFQAFEGRKEEGKGEASFAEIRIYVQRRQRLESANRLASVVN